MLAMGLAAMIYGCGALAYAATHSIRVYQTAETVAGTAGMFASACSIGAILAIIIVLREMRLNALLRLSPNVLPLIVAMNVRLALIAVLCLPPAIALRALVSVKHPFELTGVISLADISTQGYLTVLFTLIYVATLIAITR